jgi:hypothetical protein
MSAALTAVIGEPRDAEVRGLSSSALLLRLEDRLAARDRLDAEIAELVAQADRSEATVDECGRTTRSWLREEMRFSRADASVWTHVARSLAGCPVLAAAFHAGDISLAHVRAILRCLRTLEPVAQPGAEQILVDAARHCSPDDLTPVVEALRAACGDETAEEREARKYDSRWCTTASTFDGMLHLEAMLEPESGQVLLTALAALTATAPADDPRSIGQCRADALTDLARIAMARGELPDHNGDRPQLVVTLDYDTLLTQLATADRPGATLDRLGPTTVTPETARRLACDADLIPAVLGGDSQPLDLGRHTPTWTVHQRRAAALRDHGCTFPGCRAGLDRCQLHHLHHWSRGGPTDLTNSAYLCHFHHWLVHHRNWTIHRDPLTDKVVVERTDPTYSPVRRT